MSPSDYRTERMSKNEARKHIQFVISKYPKNIWFSNHAKEELQKDGLTTLDALNVLKSKDSKIYDEGECEQGAYRYRLETTNLMLVIAFSRDGKNIIIVTAWDKRK